MAPSNPFGAGQDGGTWTIFAHEIGHNFGGQHPFASDISKHGHYGGIMDYRCMHSTCGGGAYADDQRIGGAWQFNTGTNQANVCQHISSKVDSCPGIKVYVPSCGNNVVEGNEECECQDNTKSCSFCKDCMFTSNAAST